MSSDARQLVIGAFEGHLDTLVVETVGVVVGSGNAFYSVLPREFLLQAIRAAFLAVLADLQQESNSHFAAYLARVGQQRVEQGATVRDIISGFTIGIDAVSVFFSQRFQHDMQALSWWFERIHHISQAAAIALSDAMLTAREQVIYAQSTLIRDLSTPIIPLDHDILLVPLVGAIDAPRAGQIMENLLDGITQHQAEFVILDLTGVPLVDTSVAHALLQTVKAARYLGADVVLVGIGAAMAQSVVQLGIDLTNIAICANLQGGIDYALRQQQHLVSH
ncbi:MAG: STAS domain-containing protein [Chloroflexales bacterium]|nr:STAS domain-containing protein [Chloroflexales bacterium]